VTLYWQSVTVTEQCTLKVTTEHGQSVNQQLMMAQNRGPWIQLEAVFANFSMEKNC